MPGVDTGVIVVLTTLLTAAVGGVIAYRRSAGDRDSVVVATSKDVVEMVREQLNDMDARLTSVEASVSAWERWADTALAILDRAMGLLDAEHRALLAADEAGLRVSQPTRAGRKLGG
jgi:hypothetical protein